MISLPTLGRALLIGSASLFALTNSANAAIVSLDSSFGADTITRDTSSGLDWLDLTLSLERSYNDVSNKLGTGQEFEGYRYATQTEVQTLWMNLGVENGTNFYFFKSDVDQFNSFNNAVALLGDTFSNVVEGTWIQHGTAGLTADMFDSAGNPARFINGLYTHEGQLTVQWWPENGGGTNDSWIRTDVGSYLVTSSPVPVPAAAWLFGSALLGLVGLKRRKN